MQTTLWEGGTVVVPAFAIGRTQEMLLVCAEHDIPCYVDGMGVEITETLRQYPDFVRDGDALKRAAGQARVVDGRDGQRKRITDQKAAIITASGMLGGEEILVLQFAKIVGPALIYSAVAAETDRQIIQKVIILWNLGSTLLTRSESNEHSFVDSLYRENVL